MRVMDHSLFWVYVYIYIYIYTCRKSFLPHGTYPSASAVLCYDLSSSPDLCSRARAWCSKHIRTGDAGANAFSSCGEAYFPPWHQSTNSTAMLCWPWPRPHRHFLPWLKPELSSTIASSGKAPRPLFCYCMHTGVKSRRPPGLASSFGTYEPSPHIQKQHKPF